MPTNFDVYVEEKMRDPDFVARAAKARRDWDLALAIAFRRQDAGLSQKQLADRVGTTQQQISRLERPGYRGSLTTLERVADALGLDVRIELTPRRAKPAAKSAAKPRKAAPRGKKRQARRGASRPASAEG